MAVGLAVAFVALGAFVTVRMQMTSTLDESLLDRARQAAESPPLIQFPSGGEVPAWALVATDVRVAVVSADGRVLQPDRAPNFPNLDTPEVAVARGQADSSIRTISESGTDYRVVAVPYPNGRALVLAQSLAPQEHVLERLGAVMLLFGLAGVIAAAMAGRGPQRPEAGPPADHGR